MTLFNPDKVTTITGAINAVSIPTTIGLFAYIPFPFVLIPLAIVGASQFIHGYYTNKK